MILMFLSLFFHPHPLYIVSNSILALNDKLSYGFRGAVELLE